jgi:hypothetical protein
MKKVLTLILIHFIIIGCTDEPEVNEYDVSILNNSNENVVIEAYLSTNLVRTINLLSNQSGLDCNYRDENFRGFFSNECGIDLFIIKFSNNKGYIVDDEGTGDLNFMEGRNPFLPNGGFEINNNDYKFKITQEDFDNAFDLP